MLIFTIAVILGFIILIWSADQFVDGAASLAQHWGVSPLIIGMLIIGLGTSAPVMRQRLPLAFQEQRFQVQ